jgi:hypothetical protein
MKDSADAIMKINLIEFEQKPPLHRSEHGSFQKINPLINFNSYRKDLFERLNKKDGEFKFSSVEEPLLTWKSENTDKQSKNKVHSPVEPSVPSFLTILLK